MGAELLDGSPVRQDKWGLYFWEGIPECSGKKCILFKKCLYPKAGVCGFRNKYIRVVEGLLMRALGRGPVASLKIGSHLIPLYNQLFLAKMKFAEKESKENGQEIREILRSIEAVLRTMSKTAVSRKRASGSDDEAYYERMSSIGEEKAGKLEKRPWDKKLSKRRKIKKKGIKRLMGLKPAKVDLEAVKDEFGVV